MTMVPFSSVRELKDAATSFANAGESFVALFHWVTVTGYLRMGFPDLASRKQILSCC
jgi:hypothetical protein